MTDDKLKEILLEQMYALNRVETNDKFLELRKLEWKNTVETYQAKRIQKLYFYWKNRRYVYMYILQITYYIILYYTICYTIYYVIFCHILYISYLILFVSYICI